MYLRTRSHSSKLIDIQIFETPRAFPVGRLPGQASAVQIEHWRNPPMAEVLLEPVEFCAKRFGEVGASLIVSNTTPHRETELLDLLNNLLELVQRLFAQHHVHFDFEARILAQPRELLAQRDETFVREVRWRDAIDRHGHRIEPCKVQLAHQLIRQQKPIRNDVRPATALVCVRNQICNLRMQQRLATEEIHDRYAQLIDKMIHALNERFEWNRL
jgi:hypothetical protein